MKVLLVTQYFYPENFKSNDIAFELAKRGCEVDVLAGIPNYPEGKFYERYGIFKKRVEKKNGVSIYRSFQVPRGKGGGVRLMINYLSYVCSACFNVLFFFAWRKYDAVIVHEVSPIFQVYPAILLKKIKKVPIYLWVLDIWPDAMMSGGGVKNNKVLCLVNKLVDNIYKNCDKILISSRRFTESILPRGDFVDKIEYFPNWSEDLLQAEAKYSIPQLPNGFVVMLAGNLGHSQDLDAIVKAIVLLKEITELKWVFVGNGSEKEWLDNFIKDNDLSKVAFTLGRFPAEAMPVFFKEADALLVTLRNGFPHLGMVVPARLQAYMSAGRPVLAMIGNGGADIINESKCGFAVPAGDYLALVNVIKNKVLTDRKSFDEMGRNGRVYFEKEFQKDLCIDNLYRIIKEDLR